mgnify:CR=1 FL=1
MATTSPSTYSIIFNQSLDSIDVVTRTQQVIEYKILVIRIETTILFSQRFRAAYKWCRCYYFHQNTISSARGKSILPSI